MDYERGATVITPTGVRPEAFALCCHYVIRQTYMGPFQWVVVDDGHPHMMLESAAFANRDIEVTRVFPLPSWVPGQNTLARNLIAAIPHVRYDRIFFMEDDEWYAADYLETQLEQMSEADIVGERPAVYYNIQYQLYAQLWNNVHASQCSTGIRYTMLPALQRICEEGEDSIDIRLWAQGAKKHLYVGERSLGIKGMPGRPGLGTGHRPTESLIRWNYDSDWRYLRSRTGNDCLHYQAIASKETEGDFEVFYWNGQKRFRCNQKWENGVPCGFDTFNYQDLLTHVSQPHNLSGKRRKLPAPPQPSRIVGPDGEPVVREELRTVTFREEE